MTWDDVWKIILAALTIVGGISGLILFVIKFSSNIIAKQLSKKYDLKLSMELEKYKSGLDNKIYFSKTKFDTEFNIYRELSKTFFQMVKNKSIMIPSGYSQVSADETARKEYEKRVHSNALSSVVLAQDITLNGSAPFIPDSFLKKYSEILKLSQMQLNVFEQRWNILYLAPQAEKGKIDIEDYKRTGEINQKLNESNNSIREYLSRLDVLE